MRICFLISFIISLCLEQSVFAENTLPPDQNYFSSLGNINIGEYLGWKKDETANACGGYYLTQPLLYTGPKVDAKTPVENMPLQISAESGQFYLKGTSSLSGDVLIMQADKQIFSDNAYIYRKTDGSLKNINMLGNVHIQEPGKLLIADVAAAPIQDETISHFRLYDVIYRVTLGELNTSSDPVDKKASRETGLIAWGYAKEIEQTAPDQLDLHHASYSTCPPEKKTCAWHLTTKDLHLDKKEGEGTAHHSTLWVRNIPVMYLPYFSFPIDNRRKSGFLYPSFTSSSSSGLSYTQPYYFNLASNYDLVISPTYYEERGTYIDSNLRYLTQNSSGYIDFGIIPNDRKFKQFQEDALSKYSPGDQLNELEEDSDTRKSLKWINNTYFNKNWTGNIDFNYLSDDYIGQDISQSNLSETQLLQEAKVNYYGEYWDFEALLKGYQTLHPINQDLIYNQYARLPELTFNADIPDAVPNLDYGLRSQFDYFYIAKNPDDSTYPTTGYRLNARPKLELPHQQTYGYITPSLEIDTTTYQLSHPQDNNSSDPSRIMPMFDLDSGLYFNRETSVWDKSYKQTLEPRLYYLYVPYKNQDNLPDFDSTLYTLTYDQLFQNNRFSSVDRIGDANQISYGATTRYIDQLSGMEKMNFSLGEILYFQDRKVNLCTSESCEEENREPTSPVVAETNYFFSQQWSLTGDTAYDTHEHSMQNASAMIHYKKDERRVINLGYSYVGDGSLYTNQYNGDTNLANLSQIHSSYAWPISAEWNSLGGLDWDTNYTSGVSFMLGAEYSSCCWGLSFMVNQVLSGVNNGENQYDRIYYIQFVLKGLGEVNSRDSSSLISENIANYQNNFLKPF